MTKAQALLLACAKDVLYHWQRHVEHGVPLAANFELHYGRWLHEAVKAVEAEEAAASTKDAA